MEMIIEHGEGASHIIFERGIVAKGLEEIIHFDRKVLIVTDEGVPREYALKVAECAAESQIVVIPQGEQSKSVTVWQRILDKMVQFNMGRSDCVCSVGGGVVSDVAGFAAASYMRGINHYIVSTTVLSQVDASVGGKTAINYAHFKNNVGAFHQPRAVIIDGDLLNTLPDRHVGNGLFEALKMAVCFDSNLFKIFETANPRTCLDDIIPRSIELKRRIVCADEKESGLRRSLNFGHTVGHGIESCSLGKTQLLHGECVALGMLAMCEISVAQRLVPILKKIGIEQCASVFQCDKQEVLEAIMHDKKATRAGVCCVWVSEIGSFEFRELDKEEISRAIDRLWDRASLLFGDGVTF